jgi:uncharacterized protein (TIGR02145 family)
MKKRYLIILTTIVSLFLLNSLLIAQNIVWPDGGTKMQGNLISYDTNYLEVYFYPSANSTNSVSVTITPQAGSGISVLPSVPTPLTGNTHSYPSTPKLTGGVAYDLGVLTGSTDVVRFKIPIISTDCNNNAASIEVKLSGGLNIPVSKTLQTVPVTRTLPIINANIIQPVPDTYTSQGESKTYKVLVSASQGKIYSAKITVRMNSKFAYATNFKFNSLPVTAVKTKFSGTGTNVTANDSLWTITLTPAILATTTAGVIEGSAPDTLYFDAVTKNNCGVKVGYVNAWGPSTAATDASSCFKLGTDRMFTLTMDAPAGRPALTRANWRRIYNQTGNIVDPSNFLHPITNYTAVSDYNIADLFSNDNSTRLDYSLPDNVPNYYNAVALNNTGGAYGIITYNRDDARPGSDYVSGTNYIDTANIYYYITDKQNGDGNLLYGGIKKMGPQHWYNPTNSGYWTKFSETRRKLKPEYKDKIVRFSFSIPEPIPDGGSFVYFVGMKEGIFYDETTSVIKHSTTAQESGSITANYVNWYASYRYNTGSDMIVADTCGSEYNTGHTGSGDVTYRTFPFIKEEQLDIQFIPGEAKIFTIPYMNNGNIMNHNFSLECDVVIQLPDWLEIDMTQQKPVRWRNEDLSNEWIYSSITNKGNGKYVIHYKSDNTVTCGVQNMTGAFTVYYKTTAAANNYTSNQSYTIEYSIDLFTSGDSTETAARPKLPGISRAGQSARLIVEHKGINLYDFHLHRITRGYTDKDNDNIPDDANLAPDEDIDHYRYIALDSGYMTWKGKLLGNYDNAAFIVCSPTNIFSTNGTNNHINTYHFKNNITVKIKRASNGSIEYLPVNKVEYNLKITPGEENGVQMQYRKIGVKILEQLYLNDSIEVTLPFTALTQGTDGQMTAMAFVTNQPSSFDPFTIDSAKRFGIDTVSTSLVRLRYSGYYSNTDYNYYATRPNNTVNGVYALNQTNSTTIPDNNTHIGFYSNNLNDRLNSYQAYTVPYAHLGSHFFQYEARPSIIMDSLSITLPKGYRFIGDSINYNYRINGAKTDVSRDYNASTASAFYNNSTVFPTEYLTNPWYNHADNHCLESDAVSKTVMAMNLKKYFDANSPTGSVAVATGKARNPIERVYFEPKPYYYATKGAPISDYAYVTFFYKRIPNYDVVPYSSVTRVPLLYTGACNKITAPVPELTINTGRVTLPSVSLQNPSSDTTNYENWLYVKGNVQNVKIIFQDGTEVAGVGYQKRYVKVADIIVHGQNAPFFNIEFQYDGASGICKDTLTVIAISGFNNQNWEPTINGALNGTPAIDYPWNENETRYTGDYFECLLDVIVPTINGTLTLTNDNAAIPDNMVAFEETQTLKAMLAAEGTTGSDGALRGRMTITVPKGQEYVANSATISYPAGTTPVSLSTVYYNNPTPTSVEDYIVSQIGGLNPATERTFVFDFEQFTDTMPSLIDGIGADSCRQAVLTMQFKPGCNTPTNGLIYTAVLNGESACGVTAVHDGTHISSTPKYPQSGGGYYFEINPSTHFENGITAVGPIDTIIKASISMKKSGVSMISNTDSLQIIMGEAFHLVTPVVCTGGISTNILVTIGSDIVANGIRTVTVSFPYDYFNIQSLAPNYGSGDSLKYDIELSFHYDEFTGSTYNTVDQTFATHVISEQSFDASCGTPVLSVIGAFDTTLAAVDFDPYPAVLCREVPHPVDIVNYDDFLFMYDWYSSNNTYQGPGYHPNGYIVPDQTYDTLYVKIFDSHDLNKVNGIVRYPYETYNWFEAHVGPDTACLNVPTKLLDQSILNGTPTPATNHVWYVDGSYFSSFDEPECTFTTTGWHHIDFYSNYEYNGTDPYASGSPCSSIAYDSIFVRALPTITCPAPIDIMLRGGQCDTMHLDLGTPTSPNDPAVTYTNNANPPYSRGITEIEWYVQDVYCPTFNADTCIQIVAVNMPPCGYNDEVYHTDGSTTITHDGAIITDHEGNPYYTNRYCCDCWTISNLKSTEYADGTAVEYHKYHSNMYPEEDANVVKYGLLYDYAAATKNNSSAQGICPNGWHLPTTTNFNCLLTNYIQSDLKTSQPGPNFWLGETGITNASNFSAVPSGYYDGNTGLSFRMLGDAWFWIYDATSTGPLRLSCHLFFGCPEVLGSMINENWGVNVRCVKD